MLEAPQAPTGGGLTTAEATASRASDGANVFETPASSRLTDLAGRSAALPVIPMLLVVAAVYAFLGEWRDAIVAAAALVAVTAIEVWTVLRERRGTGALARFSAPPVRVWRDGSLQELPPQELVCGDLIVLAAGSRVPADARVLDADKLLVDESLVTGEPQPVELGPGAEGGDGRQDEDGEGDGELKAGTRILRGRATALVTRVGAASTMGRVNRMMAATAARAMPTPRQREQAALIRRLLLVAPVLAALAVGVARLRGLPMPQIVHAAVTLAFAGLPLELPVLLIIVAGIAALSLARRGAILRRRSAMETMAAMTLVCTDKTGTLTANRIVLTGALAAVDALEPAEGRETQDPEGLTRIAKIASERPAPDDPRIDPIDVAVWQSGDWEPPAPIARFGFDSSRRLSSALAEVDGRLTLCVKGAVEAVLVRCTGWRDGALTQPLDSDRGTAAMAAAHTLASGGARVLAVASREMAGPPTGGPSALERDLVLEGFLAFSDPLRPEVPAAIDELFRAGVAVTMVTGDGPATAESVARQAGLGGPVFIGAQIRSWAQDEIAARTAEGCVVARARPEDKLHIVQAATAAGEVVAVTGDGVNDAPALLAAALGVAIGRGGSEAARESADMVLADDNFATLARAAAEARRLSSNLRQAVRYYLVVKLALIAASLALIAAGHAALFTPLQIVVVGLFAVASASIIFISGPPSGARWPRDPKAPLLDVSMLVPSLIGSLALAIVGAAGFLIAQHWLGERAASTIALAFWLVCQGLLGLALAWDPGPEPARALTRQPAMLAWAVLGAGAAAGILLLPPLAAFLAR